MCTHMYVSLAYISRQFKPGTYRPLTVKRKIFTIGKIPYGARKCTVRVSTNSLQDNSRMDNYPEKGTVPLEGSQQGTYQQGEAEVVYNPQAAQTVIIHTAQTVQRYDVVDNYNGRLSVIFGIVLICLQTLVLVLNGIGFYLQTQGHSFWTANIGLLIIFFPTAWNAIIVYVSAAFAIGSGRTKNRCMVITNMVLAIMASVLTLFLVGMSLASVTIDVSDYMYRHNTAAVMGCLFVSLFILLAALAEFVVEIWCSVLCCQATCFSRTINQHIVQMPAIPGSSETVETPPPQYQP